MDDAYPVAASSTPNGPARDSVDVVPRSDTTQGPANAPALIAAGQRAALTKPDPRRLRVQKGARRRHGAA